MILIPMPGRLLDGSTVIASFYTMDSDALVLLLRDSPPFYQKVNVSLITGKLRQGPTFYNIARAVEDWE